MSVELVFHKIVTRDLDLTLKKNSDNTRTTNCVAMVTMDFFVLNLKDSILS